MAFKRACTNLNIYDVWDKTKKEHANAQTNESQPTARRALANHNAHTSALTQALKEAIGEHGNSLLAELRNMSMGGGNTSNIDSNNNHSNSSDNMYLLPNPNNIEKSETSLILQAIQNLIHRQKLQLPSTTKTDVIDTTGIKTIPNYQQHTLIPDSGATHHMTDSKQLFEDINYYDKHNLPKVLLGDKHTTCNVHGYGYIKFHSGNQIIRLHSLYIPSMGNTTLLFLNFYPMARKVLSCPR